MLKEALQLTLGEVSEWCAAAQGCRAGYAALLKLRHLV